MIFERIIGPFCLLLSRQSAALDIQIQRHPFPTSPLHDLLGTILQAATADPKATNSADSNQGLL